MTEQRVQDDRITDITLTVPGHLNMDDPFLESVLERAVTEIEKHFGIDVLLSSHACNDDGETFRTVSDERDRLRLTLLGAHLMLDADAPISAAFGRQGVATFVPHASVWCSAEGAVTIRASGGTVPARVRVTTVTQEAVDKTADILDAHHYTGDGCGDPRSSTSCSNCFGGRPSGREVVAKTLDDLGITVIDRLEVTP